MPLKVNGEGGVSIMSEYDKLSWFEVSTLIMAYAQALEQARPLFSQFYIDALIKLLARAKHFTEENENKAA